MPASERPPDDPRFDLVVALYTAMDKVMRSLRLYEGHGPLLDRQFDDLMQKAAAATAGGEVTVRVASPGLIFAGRPLSEEDRRQPHLFRLFCDGVRELTILPGIDRDELRALLTLFGSETRASDEDMVTQLWRADLAHVRHYAVDSFTAGAFVDPEADLTLMRASGASEDRGAEGQASTLSEDDIRAHLSEERLRWVKGASIPPRLGGPGLDGIRARLRALPDYSRFVAIGVRAAERNAAATGSVHLSPFLVGHLDGLITGESVPEVAAMLTALSGAAAAGQAGAASFSEVIVPERTVRLRGAVAREPAQFAEFFPAAARHGREGALALFEALPAGEAQSRLRDALVNEGADLTPFYVARLGSAVEAEVLDAIAALGRIGTPAAIQALSAPLQSASTASRAAALRALDGRYSADLRAELGRLLKDPSREIRQLALKILRGSGDSRVGLQLLRAVEDPAFGDLDPLEQEHLYVALAGLHDNRTLGHFQTMLADKNLLRSKAVKSRQLLCVRGLAAVGTPEAKALLERYKSSWYLPGEVREAIEKALR